MPSAVKPLHVAIIMDGNGRWASKRGLPRLEGHRAGAQAVERAVETALAAGVGTLTLYAFSTENWNRPWHEVRGLMTLLEFFLRRKISQLGDHGVRLRWLGRRDRVPAGVRRAFEEVETRTAKLDKLTLVLAVDYGGRWELIQTALNFAAAVNRAARAGAKPALPGSAAEEQWAACLPAVWLPPVDLLIRTSGECRLSNFLPWHSAYAELHFSPVLWPDFGRREFTAALDWYSHRQRRFGSLPLESVPNQAAG